MIDPTMQDVLAELATMRQRMARYERRCRRSHRLVPVLTVALLVALLPLGLLAANPFNDLNTGSPHNANIDAIYSGGITTGCVPNESYCPNDFVTREQMASFLARTAGLGSNPPVANAKTAVNATSAASAANANTVGGYAPSGLLRVGHAERFTALSITPTPQTYLTVTVVAPAPGFVILSGNVTFRSRQTSSLTTALGYMLAYADLRHEQTGATNYPTAATTTIRLIADSWVPTPINHTFPVQAGMHSFQVRVALYDELNIVSSSHCLSDNCFMDARTGSLDALFVPFGYDGGTTLAP